MARTANKRRCITPKCRNNARKGRRMCHRCAKRKWRNNNPLRAAFYALKDNAKRRGKVFMITLDDFKEFCYEFNYLQGRGRSKTGLTVDCKINALGYTPGNLQALTLSDNARKNKFLMFDYLHPELTTVLTVNTMSRVPSYKCDKCNTIKHIDSIVGIALTQDIHDPLRSFPIANADECQVHVCTECYTEWVDVAAGRLASRKHNEEKYQQVRNELSYTLRKTLVLKVLKPDLKTVKKDRGKSLHMSS